MLSTLRIRNLALVEELEWAPGRGFIAVTGETGSGKSIIVGALKLILGERADKTLIRTGADGCTVEAVFQVGEAPELNAQLEAQGIEPCVDAELILKRAFTASGTNRQFINCCPTTLAVLKEVAAPLVDLHGPHDHQSLLSAERQLELLDGYAGAEKLRAAYAQGWRKWQAVRRELAELSSSEAAMEREVDLLRHQVREIESAKLEPGEEESLLTRYTLASNARRLIELSTQVCQRLADAEDAVLPRLAETQRMCQELERLDPAAGEFAEAHARATVELEELARALQDYGAKLDLDPAQAATLEERVSAIETLKRKYGPALEDVIGFGQDAAARLHRIESRGAELERLEKEAAAAEREVRKTGGELSKKRAGAAPKLAGEVKTQLQDLGFRKSEFEVKLERLEAPGAGGMEAAEFLICPNPGEPLKPLKAIASSGEISRLMLAMKTALAAQDAIPLMIFDEIDANVGGEIAHAVGAKMRGLGRRHQVMAITHLPQVAAVADAQFVVNKQSDDGRTLSTLTAVSGKSRVEEIARMLGGRSGPALAHAKELLQSDR